MLAQVQIIKENGQAKFAVIPFNEYLFVKDILSSRLSEKSDFIFFVH